MLPVKPNSAMKGFTLIEILVTLLVFWLGMLGVSLFTANALKISASNQVRATAIKAASLSAEPMIYHTRADCLSMFLATYPRTVSLDNGKDNYVISLVSAIDGSNTTIATGTTAATTIATASGSWVSPITVTLRAPYQGLDGMVTATSTYTVVLQSYTAVCHA